MPLGPSPLLDYYRVTKEEAAHEQIHAAIFAFEHQQYAAAITLALAAEGMKDSVDGDLWQHMLNNPNRTIEVQKHWAELLNETRNWLKHKTDKPTMMLSALEAGLAIVRAITRWYPNNTPQMVQFQKMVYSSGWPITSPPGVASTES